MGRVLVKNPLRREKAEYSVYVYHYPANFQGGGCAWEKTNTTCNIHRALKKAEKLHKSHKYKRVEVKVKAFDPKYGRMSDNILKTYEDHARYSAVPVVIGVASACAVMAAFFLYE